MELVSLLVWLLILVIVLGLIWWAVTNLAGAFGLPGQIVTLLQVAMVVLFVILLLSTLFGGMRVSLGR